MVESPSNPIDRIILRVASLFGRYSKEVERFIKFSIVGVIGAVVDFSTLNLLQSTVLSPVRPHQNLKIVSATAIAFCAAVFSNFMWNRYWTYPDSRTRSFRRQLAMFYSINTAALFFRVIFVSVSYHFLAGLGDTLLQKLAGAEPMDVEALNQLGTNISQAIAVGLAMFWNFGVNRVWTYNDVLSARVSAAAEEDDYPVGDDDQT